MSAQISLSPISRIGAAVGPHVALAVRTTWQGFRRAYKLALRAETSRRNLQVLDDRMLSDIGISRAQADFEAQRKPWHYL